MWQIFFSLNPYRFDFVQQPGENKISWAQIRVTRLVNTSEDFRSLVRVARVGKVLVSQYFTKSIGMAWPPLMTDTIIENPWSKSIIHKIKRIILPTSPVFFKGTMDYFIQISLNLRAFRLSERKMVSISMDWFVRAKREWFVASFFLIRKVTVLDTYKIILRRSEQLWYM